MNTQRNHLRSNRILIAVFAIAVRLLLAIIATNNSSIGVHDDNVMLLLHVNGLAVGRKKAKAAGGGGGSGGFGSVSNVPNFVHTPDDGKEIKRLYEFLTSQGSTGLENVDIGYTTTRHHNQRGLYAKTKFKKNQIVCKIPSDCALVLNDPTKDEQGEDNNTAAQRGMNFLDMYVKNVDSNQLWSPYLDTLPKQQDGIIDDPTPDFFIADDIELFEFPRLIQKAKERKNQIEQLASERSKDDGTTIEELRYATWLTSSRNFQLSIPDDDPDTDENNDEESGENKVMPKYDEKGQIIDRTKKKSLYVMVPFLDMANHNSDQSNCRLTLIDPEKDDAFFALESTRPISPGKELVISYGSGGAESSVELLLNYGFVPKTNKIDALMISKGGDDVITNIDDWTTTIDEDRTMLNMAEETNDPVLQKILQFRIRLKESY